MNSLMVVRRVVEKKKESAEPRTSWPSSHVMETDIRPFELGSSWGQLLPKTRNSYFYGFRFESSFVKYNSGEHHRHLTSHPL